MVVLTHPTVALPTWRIVAAASIGNALEWFDLRVYGYLAVTLSRLFFPSNDENASLLLTLGTFGRTMRSYSTRSNGSQFEFEALMTRRQQNEDLLVMAV